MIQPTPMMVAALAAMALVGDARGQSLTPQPSQPATEAAACAGYDSALDHAASLAKLQALLRSIPPSCPAFARAKARIALLGGGSQELRMIGAPPPHATPETSAPPSDPMSGMPTPHRHDEPPP